MVQVIIFKQYEYFQSFLFLLNFFPQISVSVIFFYLQIVSSGFFFQNYRTGIKIIHIYMCVCVCSDMKKIQELLKMIFYIELFTNVKCFFF